MSRSAPLLDDRIESAPLDATDKRLLDEFQRGFPLSPRPYADIGRALGIGEPEVLERLERLMAAAYVTRVGPVLDCQRVGASTLAAMAVPPDRLESVARRVSRYREVNHNYERDHDFNLWFVVTALDRLRLTEILQEIERATGIEVLELPLERPYHIDLGFRLW